ncbi:hypothetical protein NPN18_25665, partial [Vibrio parahaemolyticus]|nr:hypothetical protein [Vibrio parahaemolyticus]
MAENSLSDGGPADSVEAAKNASNTEKLTDQVMQNPQVLAPGGISLSLHHRGSPQHCLTFEPHL